MSTQSVIGKICTSGPMGRLEIPMKTTITDGSDNQEVKTNSDVTVTSQSLGTYADGQTVLGGWFSAKTVIAYAYILRNGRCVCTFPISSRTHGNTGTFDLQAIGAGLKLIPGDQLVVRTEA